MTDLECHSKKFCNLIFLDNNKPLKIFKQGTHIFRISFLEDDTGCSIGSEEERTQRERSVDNKLRCKRI